MSFESLRNVQVIECNGGMPIGEPEDGKFNDHLNPSYEDMHISGNVSAHYIMLKRVLEPVLQEKEIDKFSLDSVSVVSGNEGGYKEEFRMALLTAEEGAVRIKRDDGTMVYVPEGKTVLVYGEPVAKGRSPKTFAAIRDMKAGTSCREIGTYKFDSDPLSATLEAYKALVTEYGKEEDISELHLKLELSHKEGPRVTPKELYVAADFDKGEYSLIY